LSTASRPSLDFFYVDQFAEQFADSDQSVCNGSRRIEARKMQHFTDGLVNATHFVFNPFTFTVIKFLSMSGQGQGGLQAGQR